MTMTNQVSAAANAAPDQPPADLLPPDATARDVARRGEMADVDDALHGEDISFVTKQVSDVERAAVIAVLTQIRAEESDQVKRVERREREPWARSQRVPDRISDLLLDN